MYVHFCEHWAFNHQFIFHTNPSELRKRVNYKCVNYKACVVFPPRHNNSKFFGLVFKIWKLRTVVDK